MRLREEQTTGSEEGKQDLNLQKALAWNKDLMSSTILLRSQTRRLLKRMEQAQPAVGRLVPPFSIPGLKLYGARCCLSLQIKIAKS